MAAAKYLTLLNGIRTLLSANQTSAGAADAGKLIALNSAGQVDTTMMPSGIGTTAITVTASAAISAGNLVNVYNNGGVVTAKPADNTTGAVATAYAPSGIANGATGTVYLQGLITGLTGLTTGTQYFLGTNGGTVTTPPQTSGTTQQYVGTAMSTTSLEFVATDPGTYNQ